MEQLTLLLEGFPASPTAPQESGKVKKMSAIYGQRCAEQYARFPLVSSWAKTFAASLIGMEGWSSTRCALSWKVLGIKSRPLLYLRARSMPHINESEYGLLPTPRTADIEGGCVNDVQVENGNYYRTNKEGVRWGVKLRDVVENGLLPTPMAQSRETTIEQTIARQKKYGGKTRAMYLENFAVMGMLPTPNAAEGYKGSKTYNENSQMGSSLSALAGSGMLPTPTASDQYSGTAKISENYPRHTDLNNLVAQQIGKASQLNPRFVAEMMGFPSNWTESPFLNGEQKA
jgi:hypothetical protein